MIANRELTLDDYLAMCRRRLAVVLTPAPIALVLGFLISFAFPPKYTSYSLLTVEGQTVPEGYVKPIVTERVSDRMTTLTENVLTRHRLASLVSRLGLARNGKSADAVIEEIRSNVSVTQADPNAPPPGSASSSPGSGSSSSSTALPARRRARPGETDTDDVPGFRVSFTAHNPRDAQQVCAEITSMLLSENLELREEVAQSTTDFLSKQLEQAKRNLDDLDSRLSAFKREHLGRLPSDEDKNLKILTALNSQFDATTQTLNRAQQDKSFTESLLAQETAAWESLQASPTLPPLRQQLVTLQNQLVMLQARYKEDYPDVLKTEKDIAKLKAKIKELSSDVPDTTGSSAGVKMEPPDILRLRQQVHQDEVAISNVALEQKRLRERSNSYEARLTLSPDIEDQYKQLTRDNETAHKLYDDLLTNKNAAQMQTEMERRQQGEQMKLLDAATLPASPSFPIRWMFAAGGLGAGLCIGLAVAFWLELRDKHIRDEGDVLAALELPMLAFVPRIGPEEDGGKGKFWVHFSPFGRKKKTA